MLKYVKGHKGNHILAAEILLILCYTEGKGQRARVSCSAGLGELLGI